MFDDEDAVVTEFPSKWKRQRRMADSGCQTSELRTSNTGTDVMVEQEDQGVQTDALEEKDVEFLDDISPQMRIFLKKTAPKMEQQLLRNLGGHAFGEYLAALEDNDEDVVCLHTLSHASEFDLQCTSVSWNSSGQSVAVAYGRVDHEDWCDHRSVAATWNVFRRNLNKTKPDVLLEVSSCLTAITFHPTQPSILIGGTFNGEVIVWDISKSENPVVAMSPVAEYTHREPITSLDFVYDRRKKKHHVISVGGDGRLLVWDLSSKMEYPISGFNLLTNSIPRKSNRTGGKVGAVFGGTALSMSPEAQSQFILGTESGQVFKGSLEAGGGGKSGKDFIGATSDRVTYPSPLTLAFEPHAGPVYATDCSAYHRNIFLTASSDGSARVYNLLQTKSLFTLEPSDVSLFSAAWSPTRPLVLGIGAADGAVYIYDLHATQNSPAVTLTGDAKAPVYAMAFSGNGSNLLATGDAKGHIRIYQLTDALCTEKVNEKEMLSRLGGGDVKQGD